MVPDRKQEVPEEIESVSPPTQVEELMLKTGKADSLLQLREGNKAPVFVPLSVVGKEEAESWLLGTSRASGPNGDRDIISPMSLHNASGFWYDCACQLAPINGTALSHINLPELAPPIAPPPPPSSTATGTNTTTSTTDGDDDDGQQPVSGDGDAADLPPLSLSDDGSVGFNGTQGELFLWKKDMRARRERFIIGLRQATLNEFRALTQVIMDEWDKLVDTTTAEADVISDALDDIIDGLRYTAGFGILFTTFFWVVILLLIAGLPTLLFVLWKFSESEAMSGLTV